MSLTVELINDKIIRKINLLKDLNKSIKRLTDTLVGDLLKNNDKFITFINKLRLNLQYDELEEFENNYGLVISSRLTDYYTNNAENSIDSKYEKEFFKTLNSENVISNIEDFVVELKKIINGLIIFEDSDDIAADSKYIEDIHFLEKSLLKIEALRIPTKIKKNNFELCKCGKRMEVISQKSKMICECGIIKDIFGIEFEENQINNMNSTKDYKKTSQCSYDPIRHYKFWMEHIQAKENKIFPAKDIKILEGCFKRDEIKSFNINCELMRKYLKESHLTQYNNNTPLLVKMFSNKSPPQLSPNEHRIISIKFNMILEIYEKTRFSGNRIYCPYFIYKICEQLFKNNPEKLEILKYIHLQSEKTLKKNDLIYEKICKMSNGSLIYCPTKL